MTKKEIVRQISNELGIEQEFAKKIIQRSLDSFIEVLLSEGRLELRNFGVFQVKQRAARRGRNPKTNEVMYIPSKNTVVFHAGKRVLSRLQ